MGFKDWHATKAKVKKKGVIHVQDTEEYLNWKEIWELLVIRAVAGVDVM